MTAVTIQSLDSKQSGVLLQATVENFNWNEHRFSSADIQGSPIMGRYTEFVPKRGDFGFLALQQDSTVGVVWAQFFPKNAGTWGFVDVSIPEISLWVQHDHRRRGIGRMLIHAVQYAARLRALPGLSLSVEQGNPARGLYLAEGFTPVAGREQDGVMLWHTDEVH